jgi:hypothetical protein
MQGNLHLGKYSNFFSIKILVKALTEHCSLKLGVFSLNLCSENYLLEVKHL